MRVSGRLQNKDGHTALVEFKVDDHGILRIRSGRRPIGAWALNEVTFERLSLFRFGMTVEDETFLVIPDDPTAFARAVGAVVDLREGRFGLAARLSAPRDEERSGPTANSIELPELENLKSQPSPR